jgi:hypothetical protein
MSKPHPSGAVEIEGGVYRGVEINVGTRGHNRI